MADLVDIPAGYSVTWSGQFEYLERAAARLQIVVPFTLAIIFVLLYLTFRSVGEAVLMMATLPFALVGGFWFIYLLGHHVSVASGVGFIALAGVAAEFGVVMLIYLDEAIRQRQRERRVEHAGRSAQRIADGAVLRVRPKAMTVAVIIAGLLPLFVGAGHRQRSDAAHRGADDRRHDHCAAAVDDRAAGRVSADAAPLARKRATGQELSPDIMGS